MTTNLMRLEKISREIIEKHDEILNPQCLICDMCTDHHKLLMRANFQALSLVRGIVAYLEKVKEDRREKRRRHKENVRLRKIDF